jgi:hypothetical protein
MFTIHAGEYLVGNYIEGHFGDRWNVWIPSKDTGIDLLVTDRTNQRTVSVQVKFGKDFLPGKSAALRNSLCCLSWFTLNRAKLDASQAEFWVFVLRGFTSDEPDFLVVPTPELRQHMEDIHGHENEKLQSYLCSTKSRCWETRGLPTDTMLQIAKGTYQNDVRDFSKYLNDKGWDALEAKLDRQKT